MSTKSANTRFSDFYCEHHSWLVNWLRRRLGSIHDANDLAQDTFVRLLGKPLNLGTVRRPRAWLGTVAHGIMVDHIRRRDLERAYLEAVAHLPESEVPSPEARFILLETLSRIDVLLEGLSSRVRSAFFLSRLEGMTYPEIADHLEVSVSSVEKYMAKAIKHCLIVKKAA